MKRNMILLVDADADTCAATLAAARAAGFDVRFAQIQRDLSEITEFGLDEIAVIVLDYDPNTHEPTVAETLAQWQPPRPLIFISSNELPRRRPILAGRATKHLTKPVTVEQLAHAIGTVVNGSETQAPCCDRWGHPCNGRRNGSSVLKADEVAARVS